MSEQLIAMGVDGAKGGWIAACQWRGDDGTERTELVLLTSVDQLATVRQEATVVAIDVPIGLPEGDDPRPCDAAARVLLAPERSSSVFPAPSRWMLKYAGDYTGLRTHVLQRATAGERVKSISAQGHALMPKILEVDDFLGRDPGAEAWLFECQPEVCFRALARGTTLADAKKTDAGRAARRALLTEVFPDAAAELDRAARDLPRAQVAIDDLHDAYACLHAALAVAEGEHELVGEEGRDEVGRPMRMVCAPPRGGAPREPRTDVALRPATADDLSFLHAAERAAHASGFIGHSTEAEHLARLSRDDVAVRIVTAGDDEPAGFVILADLGAADGNVEVVRFVITRPGEGIGPVALALAVDLAFSTVATHRVWLDVVPANRGARRLYAGLGFVEEGTLREAWVAPDGERTSLVILSVLRNEWRAGARRSA